MTIQTAAPRSTARGRRVLFPAAVAGAALAAALLVHEVDPNEVGHYPTCPFLALTGYWCPGCGSLRAVHALTMGDPAAAFARNPALVPALVFAAWAWLAWAREAWTGVPVARRVAPAWSLWLLLAVVLAYWVLRNVPGWTWLSPA